MRCTALFALLAASLAAATSSAQSVTSTFTAFNDLDVPTALTLSIDPEGLAGAFDAIVLDQTAGAGIFALDGEFGGVSTGFDDAVLKAESQSVGAFGASVFSGLSTSTALTGSIVSLGSNLVSEVGVIDFADITFAAGSMPALTGTVLLVDNGNVVGDASFLVIPEPTAAVLCAMAAGCVAIRRG